MIGNPPFRQPLTIDAHTSPEWERWISNLARSVRSIQYLEPTLDPTSVAANAVVRQTFTVSGLTTQDAVIVNPPALPAGLELLSSRVTTTNTLQIVFWNTTGAPIDTGAQTYLILAVRK